MHRCTQATMHTCNDAHMQQYTHATMHTCNNERAFTYTCLIALMQQHLTCMLVLVYHVYMLHAPGTHALRHACTHAYNANMYLRSPQKNIRMVYGIWMSCIYICACGCGLPACMYFCGFVLNLSKDHDGGKDLQL